MTTLSAGHLLTAMVAQRKGLPKTSESQREFDRFKSKCIRGGIYLLVKKISDRAVKQELKRLRYVKVRNKTTQADHKSKVK